MNNHVQIQIRFTVHFFLPPSRGMVNQGFTVLIFIIQFNVAQSPLFVINQEFLSGLI